jgi:hypothetical protein
MTKYIVSQKGRIVKFILVFGLTILFSVPAVAGSRAKCGSGVVVSDAFPSRYKRWKLSTKVKYEGQPGFYKTTTSLTLAYAPLKPLEIGVTPEVDKAIWGEEIHTGGGKVSTTGNHGSVEGFGDVKAYAKYLLLKEGDYYPAIGAKYELKIPTTTDHKGLSTGEVDHTIQLLASKGMGKSEVDFNLGYTYVGEPDNKVYANVVSYALAFQYPVAKKIVLTAELTGKTNYKEKHLTGKNDLLDVYGGLKYKATKDFEVKGAFGTRVSEANPDYLGVLNLRWYLF